MYRRWCHNCEKPMKCHNIDGVLHCIGCKAAIGNVDAPDPRKPSAA